MAQAQKERVQEQVEAEAHVAEAKREETEMVEEIEEIKLEKIQSAPTALPRVLPYDSVGELGCFVTEAVTTKRGTKIIIKMLLLKLY